MAMIRICDHCKKMIAEAAPHSVILQDDRLKPANTKDTKYKKRETFRRTVDYCPTCLPKFLKQLDAMLNEFNKTEKPDTVNPQEANKL